MKIENEMAILQFLGAAGTVTGSKYLLRSHGRSILIDCGLFQGEKQVRSLNWDELPFAASEIDTVLLTHAHLDHTGYLPRIVKEGFKGKIFGSAPTLDIARIILQDSAKLQEEDADHANEHGYSKHKPALPLYDSQDVEKTIPLFQKVDPNEWIDLSSEIQCRFRYNGHILGACFVEVKVGKKVFVFSGDIGRESDPLLDPPDKPTLGDVVLIESTYGDRIHEEDPVQRLIEYVQKYANSKGSIIIPSFAVERTQLLMYLFWKLRREKKIPKIPIYLDSPMGESVYEVFENYGSNWHKLSRSECIDIGKTIEKVQNPKETRRLAQEEGPRIIIAGSGMATGGRVLSYLEHSLGDPNSLVLLVGYQAKGTRGRDLQEGSREIKIRGKFYTVKCEVALIDGLSAHADQKELLDWLSKLQKPPKHLCIVHGENGSARALSEKIKERYGWDSMIPQRNDRIEIDVS
ncbi:MBL fold metallo-hydrolase [Leptospira perolatii]|uniref:MBL fold metallo-hydrolase n=1 Tax=Leptospira perolatii TaxID=2023191 RepID=A0A2M9ZQI8_9LEPT|nr:MBL fold metallo-hydrolase [Leptospira perolatii]PJZ70449.1 MBL fold metallo-hydrolase [Leptospira perolatii]PJZ74285.1 MBL fold metallo-hydrolase [Leptospira perolatii]